ncbi:hypothetical protein HOLleu_44586 [Holothuria leucospilota]|uniref:Uncharacterized protein n=1 Tax=Holothuria leucospilota TaxID=206669 RepID=A0A9Q1BAT2_HOLLE|nr:hypothetical protein HOLleu_44586 [Holothuria leucospilota]
MQLPNAERIEFSGDPLQYWAFMRSFQDSVNNSFFDENGKLSRLMEYCSGKAKQVIQCCSVMSPKEGYAKVLALLKERFGNGHLITEFWVNKVTTGPRISSNDKEGFRQFSDDLRSCKETVSAMGFIDEINTQTVLLSIVERLPSFIQNRWVNQVRKIKKSHGKNPQIDDLVVFVADRAEELNDTVYEKLGTFKTEAHNGLYQKRGGLVKGNEKSRNFTGIVEMTKTKSYVVSQGNRILFNCTEFKDKRPPERFQIAKEYSFDLIVFCLGMPLETVG